MNAKLLLIGRIPPPIGGVSIHLSRFLEELNKYYPDACHHFNLSQRNAYRLIWLIPTYAVIHLHTSSTLFQFFISVYCQIFSKPLIITYHGNIGRYGPIRSMLERRSIALCTIPIVQNSESFSIANPFNPQTKNITTYLPPTKINPLASSVWKDMMALKKHYQYIFCTNAWNVSFDRYGQEIYGISELLNCSDNFKNSLLIVSDPSGNYQKRIQKIHPHVYWISTTHDFYAVLEIADAFIRNTTTDATCLSIQEALSLNKIVFATNCVSRPSSCITYTCIQDILLESALEIAQKKKLHNLALQPDCLVVADFIAMYQKLTERSKN